MRIENRSFEVEDYLKNLRKQISIKEEIKNILNSRNICCSSVRNFCLPGCYPKFKE